MMDLSPGAGDAEAAPAGSQSRTSSPSKSPPPTSMADAATSPSSSKKQSLSLPDAANGPGKPPKRRAARACVSCRARKVRCDVVEQSPCGNCKWDKVECIVQQSRRRKKNILTGSVSSTTSVGLIPGSAEALRAKGLSISSTESARARSFSISSIDAAAANGAGLSDSLEGHILHPNYQGTGGYRIDPTSLLPKYGGHSERMLWPQPAPRRVSMYGELSPAAIRETLEEPGPNVQLPPFVKPVPARIEAEDVKYLCAKGALTLPSTRLQNALLKAYVEYVHPYMPLMELHEFLAAINSRDGSAGQVSLFLYHAVMFVSAAFVDTRLLQEAGYEDKKTARKAFFTRTRLLYDFDYESDRLVLVQALLLMTYWYQTPDDQKDTWHWMGVAISLAHTIGLHRNPASTNMDRRKQKLWKRIWWSCFMRDRLIALGMRRPTRIKAEDFDVPMLDESDFEIAALADDITLLGPDCTLVRDLGMQQELAVLCIEKARLCILISHMLKAQYSVLSRDNIRPENTTNSTMMLFPNKTLNNLESVEMVDTELVSWHDNLPESCAYRPLKREDVDNGRATLAVQRNLLHMVYQTTVSALHRPQFLSASPAHAPATPHQIQVHSRMRVRDAASKITRMAAELHSLGLESYLPTTGVTVILPAMIIHLLDMRSDFTAARDVATRGFGQCMKVMNKLRESYAAADFAKTFLDAAHSRAFNLNATTPGQQSQQLQQQQQQLHDGKSMSNVVLGPGLNLSLSPNQLGRPSTPPPDNAPYLNSTEISMYHQGRTYIPKDLNGNSAAAAGGHSPPHTDQGSDVVAEMTPSAEGGSPPPPEIAVHLDFGTGPGQIDLNTMTGPPFDFDQYLQFPAEGVNTTDGDFMDLSWGDIALDAGDITLGEMITE
ncbi:cutinase transcription factor 1 beta 2 [Diplogelasinospora grovesii]|uniref:Cutinase transcription factor 1 beta 2 n=1 Tax=Diplogelasinospora grovesii TaxID=303347 RepID=A0AAN6S8P6_9PEZI|nr:cutinase transcription factor 1 beta 2 [Diplogelasinospora grovesii]